MGVCLGLLLDDDAGGVRHGRKGDRSAAGRPHHLFLPVVWVCVGLDRE